MASGYSDYDNAYSTSSPDEVPLQQLDQQLLANLKQVVLQKDPGKPLGFTIKQEGNDIVVGRLVCDTLSGRLRDGDRLVVVNEITLSGMSLKQATDALASLSGELTFHVQSAPESTQPKATSGFTVRALYNYRPDKDPILPCKVLGLEFVRGDIIHVVSQDDGRWWQGYKADEQADSMVRIFPSSRLQHESGPRWRRHHYERVARLQPDPQRPRPLVLVGSPGVGCQELRALLLESDANQFAPALVHTTRVRSSEEVNGVDFHFVLRGEFQQLKSLDVFIETEKFEGCLYGTSMKSVQDVVAAGKVCVLALNCARKHDEVAQSLRRLRTEKLLPHVVFVRQPVVEALLDLRGKLDESAERGQADMVLNDRQLCGIVEFGKAMDKSYGHLFDTVLEHTDPKVACDYLLNLVQRLRCESQWVPESWLQQGPPGDPDTEFR